MAYFSYFFSTVFGKKPYMENEREAKLNNVRNEKSDLDACDPNKAWMKRQEYLTESAVIPLDPKSPVPDGHIRFVCISDTHTKLERQKTLDIPDGDVLLHAGDLTMYGHPDDVFIVNEYLGT